MNASEFFAQSYSEARSKFQHAAHNAGLEVQSFKHRLKGRHGEELAVDVVRVGPIDAQRLLIISSGCHGVEGFAGSGVQNALLCDRLFHDRACKANIAVLYLHALNPWGFSWWRRWTEDNVDLNRNFRDFSQGIELPANPGYSQLAHALVPESWPCADADRTLWDYAAKYGMRGIETAVASGQYSHPDGLFFGGHSPTWSNLVIRTILSEHCAQCSDLAWLDLHTATGPKGEATMVLMSPDEAGSLDRAQSWWGSGVTRLEHGDGPMVPRTGTMAIGTSEIFGRAQYTGVILEFGTEDGVEVTNALRAAQWLDRQPHVEATIRESIDQRIRDAFYTNTDSWKRSTVAQGIDAASRAIAGIAHL